MGEISSSRATCWFRPVDTTVGPDGALYIADWYDVNLSHSNPKNRSQWYAPSRDDGRIYRVSAKGGKSFEKPKTRLNQLTSHDVAALLNHPNEWYRREAWRILGERRDSSVVPELKQKLAAASDETSALEALWAIHLCGGLDEAFAAQMLRHPGEYVRAWTVRLLGDERNVSNKVAAALVRLAKSDPSVVVRSQLACTAKRLSASAALPIAAELLKHDEDAGDPHLPLLIWWAIENKATSDREGVLALVAEPATWKRSIVRDVLVERLARRYMALGDDNGYAACAWLLEHAPASADVERIVAGMETQLAGHRFGQPPAALERPLARLLSNGRPSTELLCLAIRLGSKDAVPKLFDRVNDSATNPTERITAIRALSEAGPPQTADHLLSLLNGRQPEAIEEAALTAIGRFKEESLGTRLLACWPSLSEKLRDRAIDVLGEPACLVKTVAPSDHGQEGRSKNPIDRSDPPYAVARGRRDCAPGYGPLGFHPHDDAARKRGKDQSSDHLSRPRKRGLTQRAQTLREALLDLSSSLRRRESDRSGSDGRRPQEPPGSLAQRDRSRAPSFGPSFAATTWCSTTAGFSPGSWPIRMIRPSRSSMPRTSGPSSNGPMSRNSKRPRRR